MNPYSNLPEGQREGQRLADQFNADERVWEKLKPRRELRRKLHPLREKEKHQKIDLREFAAARPAQDAIGREITP